MCQSNGVTVTAGWEDLALTRPALQLSFRKPEHEIPSGHPAGLVSLNVRLALAGIDQTVSRLCFGSDVNEFCDGLERLHRSLIGQAEFINQEYSVRIIASVADPGRGRLAVGGQIEGITGHHPESPTVGLLAEPGLRLKFDGLVLEQSCLPHIVGHMRAFLKEAGISTRNPMTV